MGLLRCTRKMGLRPGDVVEKVRAPRASYPPLKRLERSELSPEVQRGLRSPSGAWRLELPVGGGIRSVRPTITLCLSLSLSSASYPPPPACARTTLKSQNLTETTPSLLMSRALFSQGPVLHFPYQIWWRAPFNLHGHGDIGRGLDTTTLRM